MATKVQVTAPSTPVYALIGAGDVVVAKLRDVKVERPSLDAAAVRTQVREIPEQAQAAVSATLEAAIDTYGDLAERGKRLVIRVRRQQATQDLEAQAKTAVSRGKAARTTATKQATRTRKSAASTTRTARQGAAATKTAVKSAATSAEKTVGAAATATGAAADKVGN